MLPLQSSHYWEETASFQRLFCVLLTHMADPVTPHAQSNQAGGRSSSCKVKIKRKQTGGEQSNLEHMPVM